MGEFSQDWLRLREPFDHAARSERLVHQLLPHLPSTTRVLELGCGLGSGMRWLAPRLDRPQTWTLVDHDQDLLDAIEDLPADVGRIERRIAHDIQDVAGMDWPADLVCCQALIDLVSERWLDAFAAWIVGRRVPVLIALSVDGRYAFSPAHAEDDGVMTAFRAHQHTDRGFGPSPGVNATSYLMEKLEKAGFSCATEQTDWMIGPQSKEMLRQMVQGIGAAAEEMDGSGLVDRWRTHRLSGLGDLSMKIGHLDLLALPPAV